VIPPDGFWTTTLNFVLAAAMPATSWMVRVEFPSAVPKHTLRADPKSRPSCARVPLS